MSVMKKFLGQTAIYGLSTILSRLFNFILTPIYTRVYAKEVYGIFTNLYAYASLINAILAFGMESTYFRYLNKYENRKQEVFNNSFFTIAILALIFLINGWVFSASIAQYLATDSSQIADYIAYVRYFVLILFVDAICVIPFAKLRADEKPIPYSIAKFLNIGLFVGFNLIFLFGIPYWIDQNLAGSAWLASWYREKWVGYVFLSNLIASVATLIYLWPQFAKLEWKINLDLLKDMFSYSWPILIANLSFIINENLDKIVLKELLPADIADAEVGVYGAVCKIAIFLSIFTTAFRLGAEPFFFSYAKNENARQTYALIMHYFVIALTIIFLGLVANIDILKYFISRDQQHLAEYWVGLPAVPFLLLGYVCLGIYMNLSVWYRLSDQTRFGLYISVIGAIITITFNIWLIPRYSYMGSAIVSMITYGSMMIISYLLGQKYYPIPYQTKKLLLYLGISTLLVYLSFFVFQGNLWIGNALWLFYLGGVFFAERRMLKQL